MMQVAQLANKPFPTESPQLKSNMARVERDKEQIGTQVQHNHISVGVFIHHVRSSGCGENEVEQVVKLSHYVTLT